MTRTTLTTEDVSKLLRLQSRLQRSTNGLHGIMRRIENRELTGRNGNATERAIEAHLRDGRAAVRELCDSPAYREEAHGRLIARFWKAERRALGMDWRDR